MSQGANMKLRILGTAMVLGLTACATTTSPTGRTQMVGGVSQAQLDQLGAQAFAETKAKETLNKDARQNAYVTCVVNALVRQLPPEQRSVAWETAVFTDNEPNAFALPGGKVGVNTGIFTVAKNQDQLAAVLGHEIGHVIARHHEERITRQMGAQTGLGVLGALAGARYGEGAANTVNQLGGMTAQAAFLLPGSRTQESEADVVGQRLMAQAGFDPRQAVGLWENMMAASAGRSPQWLSTHPDPANRIRELQRDAPSLVPTYEAARKAGNAPKCG
jgi:predicted Zn-dependent protease